MGSPSATAKDDSAIETDPTTRRNSGSDTESNTGRVGNDLPPPPPPSDLSPFKEGDRVLVKHSGCLYKANVLEVAYQFNEWKYFLHYIGWNKSWDEWLGLEFVLEHTDENIKKHGKVGIKQGVKKAVTWNVSKKKPKSPNVAIGRKRRKEDSVDTEKNGVASENLLSFHIPPALRKQLTDDCEYVTEMQKLVQLPCSPNVEDILKKYTASKMKKPGKVTDSMEEILKGLRCYFDKALPVMLLYNNERKQYEETVLPGDSPSTVYGAQHLLRLFVKLPELVIHVKMAEETLKELQDNLNDILRFLKKKQRTFFVSAYKTVEEMEEMEEREEMEKKEE